MRTPILKPNERGVALVMAVLVLLVLSLLAVVLMTTVSVGTKIAGHNMRESQALNTAEAGVNEAMARIRNQDVNFGTNPRGVAQIFLCAAGSVPTAGVDTTTLETRQPAGAWLDYSTAAKGPNVLTAQYKTDPAKTVIYRYDRSLNPPVQTASGLPIYVINSTGRRGSDIRRIVTEVIQKPVNGTAYAALVADVGIDFSGNSTACGYNHRSDTPAGTGQGGRLGPGGCNEDPLIFHWETGTGDAPGAWSSNTITSSGSSQQYGSPTPLAPGQTGFYPGPWAVLGMTQAEFFSWVGSPIGSEPANPQDVYYLDDNGTTQDQSGNFRYNGGDGEGMLYVDGDLTINGNFTYRGLIYVEGDLKINGTCWVLGAIIVRGKTRIKLANGTCTVLYSRESIEQNVSKYGGTFVTLSWREGV